MPTVRPPHWNDLASSYCETHACEESGIGELLRPDLQQPMWTRPLGRHRNLHRMLVAFRFLLAAETQFVSHTEPLVRGAAGGERTVEVVLTGAERDEHGLPTHPPVGDPGWCAATADLIAGSWFAHVQHTAELLTVAMEELNRSQLIAASATARTALEMAARIAHGSRELSVSTDAATTDLLTRWLAVGDGGQRGEGGPTARVQRLVEKVQEDDDWPAEPGFPLDELYERLCDRVHPRPESWSIYARRSNLPSPSVTTSPKDQLAVKAADDVLTAAAVVTVSMRSCWELLDVVVADLRRSSSPVEISSHTLATRKEVDVTRAYPDVNVEDTFLPGLTSQLRSPLVSLSGGPLMTPHVIVDFFGPGRMHEGAVRPHGSASDTAHELVRARLFAIAELQRSAIKSLNLGRCASAAALARFLLEHVLALEKALDEPDPEVRAEVLGRRERGINAVRLAELLADHVARAQSSGAEQQAGTPTAVADAWFNGMVHGDLVARKIYWREYGRTGLHAVTIPSHPKYPSPGSGSSLGLDNPWVGTAAAVDLADWVVVRTCEGLLNGRW